MSAPFQRLEMAKITGHQSVGAQDGVIAVMYETRCTGLFRPSWEREMDFQLSRQHMLLYRAGPPNRHRQTNRLYRRMTIRAAQRELSWGNGKRFLAPGYGCVRHADWLRRYSSQRGRDNFWNKGDDGLWWLWKISARTTTDGE